MTHHRTVKFHWVVLLAGLASASLSQAGISAEGAAGEPEAASYIAQNGDKFIAHAPMVTPQLVAAAIAQGQFDMQTASSLPTPPEDTPGEAQAKRYFAHP